MMQIRMTLKNAAMSARVPLSKLTPGDRGVIALVDGPDGFRQRLAALGFRAGRAIVVLRRSGLHGPLHVRLGTTDVALRLAEAGGVSLRSVVSATP